MKINHNLLRYLPHSKLILVYKYLTANLFLVLIAIVLLITIYIFIYLLDCQLHSSTILLFHYFITLFKSCVRTLDPVDFSPLVVKLQACRALGIILNAATYTNPGILKNKCKNK